MCMLLISCFFLILYISSLIYCVFERELLWKLNMLQCSLGFSSVLTQLFSNEGDGVWAYTSAISRCLFGIGVMPWRIHGVKLLKKQVVGISSWFVELQKIEVCHLYISNYTKEKQQCSVKIKLYLISDPHGFSLPSLKKSNSTALSQVLVKRYGPSRQMWL